MKYVAGLVITLLFLRFYFIIKFYWFRITWKQFLFHFLRIFCYSCKLFFFFLNLFFKQIFSHFLFYSFRICWRFYISWQRNIIIYSWSLRSQFLIYFGPQFFKIWLTIDAWLRLFSWASAGRWKRFPLSRLNWWFYLLTTRPYIYLLINNFSCFI